MGLGLGGKRWTSERAHADQYSLELPTTSILASMVRYNRPSLPHETLQDPLVGVSKIPLEILLCDET